MSSAEHCASVLSNPDLSLLCQCLWTWILNISRHSGAGVVADLEYLKLGLRSSRVSASTARLTSLTLRLNVLRPAKSQDCISQSDSIDLYCRVLRRLLLSSTNRVVRKPLPQAQVLDLSISHPSATPVAAPTRPAACLLGATCLL